MKPGTRFGALVVLGILLMSLALFAVVWVAPGWGMPGQNTLRQTVPTRTPTPVLTPEAYLPVVLRHFSGISP